MKLKGLFVCLCVCGLALSAAARTDWRAQWIWLPENETGDMLLARKTFSLSEMPERASLSITASSRYELFVNGQYINRGPARCAPHHQSYDVLDISHALKNGRNVLAVRVHHQRDGVSYFDPSRAGLLAQLDGVSADVQTDSSWHVAPDTSWLNDSPRMAGFHLEVCDRVDLRKALKDWQTIDFDDSRWQDARVLWRNVGWPKSQKNDRPTHLTPPWISLVERDIPYLTESNTPAGKPLHVGSISVPHAGDDWLSAKAIAEIPVPGNPLRAGEPQASRLLPANAPGECRALIYDLGEVQSGRPYLDIEAPSGTVIDILAAPYLLNGKIQSPIVASNYVDRIVLSGGREEWAAFYMKPTRWLAVVFRRLEGEAMIHGVGLIRSEYPFEQKGAFQCLEAPGLDALWQAAAKTIRVATSDAYTDNYRERRQYAQTAYYACLGNYAVFGDTALQRRYLMQIAQEQLGNGMMPAYAPRHGDDFMVILDSNCFWIRGLHQYLLYSGDAESTRDLLPAARKLLDLLNSYANEGGLIDSPPYPYWLDHALQDRRGANFCLNAHYLGAVEDFSMLLQWLQEPGAELYRERAERMRQTLRKQFWDAEKRLFADAVLDGERSSLFSEHANAMALALRIADDSQIEAIAAQLSDGGKNDFVRHPDGTIMVTPAMSYYLHAGLCEAGRADESWQLLQTRFAHMLTPETNGTLWEEWWLDGTGRSGTLHKFPAGRSDAQTESAFPPALFARYILGIEPTSPGMRDIVLRYHPSSKFQHRQGAVPTPSGLLEVDWDIGPAEFKITVKTPSAATVRVDLSSLGTSSKKLILIDRKSPSKDGIRAGLLTLPPGRCVVRIGREK